jgi:hypothetical protein
MHLLHHVHLAADAVEIGDDDVEPRRQRAGIFSEPLDGPVIALRHGLDAGKQRENNQENKRNRENIETGHKSSKAGQTAPAPIPRHYFRGHRLLWSAEPQRRFSRPFLHQVLVPDSYVFVCRVPDGRGPNAASGSPA